jgi:hypothetical protein
MDPLTAFVVWGASLAGIAGLVRAAGWAGRSVDDADTDPED